jgi:hypothetical protein
MKPFTLYSFLFLTALTSTYLEADDRVTQAEFHEWAKTPPMGWNSWDCFGTSITETQARQQADAMAELLLPSGYDIFTVDIQWYEPNAKGHIYEPGAPLQMDAYSRLLPAENRFPSSANGEGFKPLADYVHAKGLRFGIHIMRGIPRQAVEKNTPIFNSRARAAEIAVTSSTCPWNPDMYGVDLSKPGAQAYYDSLFSLYASWGVDYVKVDDISRPYNPIQQAEIEAIRKAIDKTGRHIVLSLSPGATPIDAGKHVMQHANLWRISDDFWDRWGQLHDMFERVALWSDYRQPGAWPDADMIPFGIIEFDRKTHFTRDEQFTLMSLWSIARSPLIFGGDMTRIDGFTLEMLSNPEVIQVNQNSCNNRQISRNNNLIVWAADIPGSKDKYVALFNAQSKGDNIDFSQAKYVSPVISGEGNSQEISLSIKGAKRLALYVKDGNDGITFDHAVWEKPTLHGKEGALDLTELNWVTANAGWGTPRVNKTCDDRPLQSVGIHESAIGTHADSMILFDIPEGYDSFTTKGVLTNKGSVVFGVVVDNGNQIVSDTSNVEILFSDLGIHGKVTVRDLWQQKDIGEFANKFVSEIPLHGATLLRLTPTAE